MKTEKIKSVYEEVDYLKGTGEITVTLDEEERMIVSNALAMLAPKEVDIIPMLIIAQKIQG